MFNGHLQQHLALKIYISHTYRLSVQLAFPNFRKAKLIVIVETATARIKIQIEVLRSAQPMFQDRVPGAARL